MTQPISFKRRFKSNLAKAQEAKAQEDRAVRQSEQYYEDKGYDEQSVEREAETDNQIAQRLNKKKRGLKGALLGNPTYY